MTNPKPIRLSHAVLRTNNVERLRSWYCDVLGAHVVFEKIPEFSFITYDEEHHRLGFAAAKTKADHADAKLPGLMHLAFTFADMRALLTVYDNMRGLGRKPTLTINHGPTVSIYYEDPDGNGVELQVDRFETAAGAQQFIDEVFDKNPVGIAFDPDKALAQMRAGASDQELAHYDRSLPMVDSPYMPDT